MGLVGGRVPAIATENYYVRATGNDNNDGLVNSDSRAFASLGKALTLIDSLDISNSPVTVNLATNTPETAYDLSGELDGANTLNRVVISGANQASTYIKFSANAKILHYKNLSIRDCTFVTSGGAHYEVQFEDCRFISINSVTVTDPLTIYAKDYTNVSIFTSTISATYSSNFALRSSEFSKISFFASNNISGLAISSGNGFVSAFLSGLIDVKPVVTGLDGRLASVFTNSLVKFGTGSSAAESSNTDSTANLIV